MLFCTFGMHNTTIVMSSLKEDFTENRHQNGNKHNEKVTDILSFRSRLGRTKVEEWCLTFRASALVFLQRAHAAARQ